MAIQQNNKIIASEINNSAATNFSQGAFIYANDIASLYGGTDNIAKGVLIRAEHFQNLGLPGSGGLNGTFNGVPFKNAIENSSSGLEYAQDSNGWTLYITKSGTINFTNFGRYGNSTDIFMIGGGGAGNKDGLSGSGGFYVNGTKELVANNSYNLVISTGGIENGAPGGGYVDDEGKVWGAPTQGFGFEARGGQGGKANEISGYYKEYTTSNWTTYDTNTNGSIEYRGEEYPKWESQEKVTSGDTIYLSCNEQGELRTTEVYKNGSIITCYYGLYDNLYQLGGGDLSELKKQVIIVERPANEATFTTIFDTTIIVGGPGSDTSAEAGSRYGQGGGTSSQYGASSFGTGKSGIIAIRNHR